MLQVPTLFMPVQHRPSPHSRLATSWESRPSDPVRQQDRRVVWGTGARKPSPVWEADQADRNPALPAPSDREKAPTGAGRGGPPREPRCVPSHRPRPAQPPSVIGRPSPGRPPAVEAVATHHFLSAIQRRGSFRDLTLLSFPSFVRSFALGFSARPCSCSVLWS